MLPLVVTVAPLAGSVDRNKTCSYVAKYVMVAPPAGSVDRNTNTAKKTKKINTSLPSRGAWIEITTE